MQTLAFFAVVAAFLFACISIRNIRSQTADITQYYEDQKKGYNRDYEIQNCRVEIFSHSALLLFLLIVVIIAINVFLSY